MISAAGILFLAGAPGAERALLLRRTAAGDAAGAWAFPGGKVEDGESALDAARREAVEELGALPSECELSPEPFARRIKDGVNYTTFACRVAAEFTPVLNDEHDAWAWIDVGNLAARGDAVVIPKIERVGVLPGRAAGRYDPETRTVTLASHLELGDGTRRALANPERLLAHERGHAADHALGWPSRDPALKTLLAAVWPRLDAAERLGADYYLGDPGEAFAEAVAFLDGPADGARYFGTLEPARVEEVLKDVIEWVRSKASA